MYRELGDIGDVAQACRRNQAMLQRPAPLTVAGVFATLQQIAHEKGQGERTGVDATVLPACLLGRCYMELHTAAPPVLCSPLGRHMTPPVRVLADPFRRLRWEAAARRAVPAACLSRERNQIPHPHPGAGKLACCMSRGQQAVATLYCPWPPPAVNAQL